MTQTLKEQSIESVAGIMKAMGDKNRLHILSLLRERELCVCELTNICHLSQSNVSQHLAKLKSNGLVKERRNAQWVYYSLCDDRFPLIVEILKLLPETAEDLSKLENSRNHPACSL
ncbi:MAG: metalloregulator ArsR/SmtB family transcription factor [Thermoplasmataceae archaeon]